MDKLNDKTMVHDGSHLWSAKRRGLACNRGAVSSASCEDWPHRAVGTIIREDNVYGLVSGKALF